METYTGNFDSDISSRIFATSILEDKFNEFDWREQDMQDISENEVFKKPYNAVREYLQKYALRDYLTYSTSLAVNKGAPREEIGTVPKTETQSSGKGGSPFSC